MLYVRMIKESKFSVKDGNLDNSVDRSNEYIWIPSIYFYNNTQIIHF